MGFNSTRNFSGIPSSLPLSSKIQSPKSFIFTSIIKNYLGEQAAYVFTILFSNGRLNFSNLLKQTNLKPLNLKKILVSLIQLNCVVYNTESLKKNLTFYSINDEGCLKLLYADEIISTVKSIYKNDVFASIIQNILISGNLTISNYIKNNFKLKSEIIKIENAFIKLINDNWLLPINDTNFKSNFDLFSKIFKNESVKFNNDNSSKSISQSKKLLIIKEKTKDNYLNLLLRNSDTNSSNMFNNADNNDDNNDNDNDNDLDLDNEFDNDVDNEDDMDSNFLKKINYKLSLTINFDRYLKFMRSTHLKSEACNRIGEITARVYHLALIKMEKNSRPVRNTELDVDKLLSNMGSTTTTGLDPSLKTDLIKRLKLKDQERGMNFTVMDIYKELKKSGDLVGLDESDLLNTIANPNDEDSNKGSSLKRKLDDNSSNEKLKKHKLNSIKLEDDDDNQDDIANQIENGEKPFASSNSNVVTDPEISLLILSHLRLLTSDNKLPFLKETNPGSFYIPFTDLQLALPTFAFKQFIKQVFGNEYLRIVNCIEEKKLIDEKGLSKLVLMKECDIRTITYKLQKFNIIEVQEIPKTQDRSAIRAAFAFRCKIQKAIGIFENCLLFNMGEVLESLEQMKLENKILLDKISRKDVKGKEHELLLTSELVQLQQYYEAEKLSLAKFHRLRTYAEIFQFLN